MASGGVSTATARPPSDMLDGQCMLTAVLRRCSSDRLSTAVQDQIPSTTSDLTMSIAAAHRHVCAASVRTRGSRAIKWESVAAAHRRVRPWCREARRALSSLMRCGRSITADSGYQLLMQNSPSTGTEDPVPSFRRFQRCQRLLRYVSCTLYVIRTS